MYFCEDHGSVVSDDGTATVRSYRDGGGDVVDGFTEPLSSPPGEASTCQRLVINGDASQPKSSSSRLAENHNDDDNVGDDNIELSRCQRNDNEEAGSGGSQNADSSTGGVVGIGDCGLSSRQSSGAAADDQLSTGRPNQLPVNGLHRFRAGAAEDNTTAYLLQAAVAAAAAATAGCAYQEVREISLGRHNEEPYGMKVEAVGEAFFITHIVRNSVAACAGLKVGDEIVRVNERRLEGLNTRDVLQAVRQSEMCVKLAYKPRSVVARIREVRLKKDNGLLGLRLQKKSDGLYIDFVKRGTSAFEAGLKDGDQVLKINSHIVTDWSMEGAMALLKSMGENEQLALLVRETLPVANLPGTGPTPLPLATSNRHHQNQQQQQPSQHTRQHSDPIDIENQKTPQQPQPDDGICEDPVAAPEETRRRKVMSSNPCTSTDDLEITELPSASPEASAVAAGNSTSASVGFSASTFLKSFHGPSRFTSFLRSSRFSRQQPQPQSSQQKQPEEATSHTQQGEPAVSKGKEEST